MIRRNSRGLRPRFEEMEPKRLLSGGTTIEALPGAAVPAGKSLILPVRATDAGGFPLTYTVTSSDPSVTATVHTGNPFLKLTVAGQGDMVFELLRDVAPTTVDKIVGLVNSGFYNNLTFHRVVPNFVIQGGDPKGDGTGGPGFSFDDEFNPNAIFSGTNQLAMANSGKDTNGSQFFVTFGPQRFLDFNHTIFGQLVRGSDVAAAIDNVPNSGAPSNKPLTPVVITSASIVADTADAVITLNARATSPGATITVRADDGHGGSDVQTFQASVAPDTYNDPPILGPVGDQTTYQDRAVSIPLTSTDLENDSVYYAAAVADASPHGSVTVAGNVVTVTPAAGYTGDIHVIVGVAQTGATARGSVQSPYDTQRFTVHAFAGPRGVADDFDGDGKSDPTIYRPSAGLWVINQTTAGKLMVNFGDPKQGDIPVPGDYDGDGKTDLAVFRPSTDQWIILPSSGGPVIIKQFGDPTQGDVPIPGNYEGNGTFDLALFRARSETWMIRYADGSTHSYQFGDPAHNDLPVPGDYEGIGKYDLALFRPDSGQWIIRTANGGTPISQFGDPVHGDIAVPGDYDGDGKTDFAIFRPGTSLFVILYTSGGSVLTQLGDPANGDLPVAAPLASLKLVKPQGVKSFTLSAALDVAPVPSPAETTVFSGGVPRRKTQNVWATALDNLAAEDPRWIG